MGCANSPLLVKYQVRFQDEGRIRGTAIGNGMIPVRHITSVSGLSLGTEDTITLREATKTVRVPTGVKSLPTLGLQLRLELSAEGLVVFDFFQTWWDNRTKTTKTIFVDMMNRSRLPFYTFTYSGSSIKSFSWEDQQLGQTKFALVNMTFDPYEVQGNLNPFDPGARTAAAIGNAAGNSPTPPGGV